MGFATSASQPPQWRSGDAWLTASGRPLTTLSVIPSVLWVANDALGTCRLARLAHLRSTIPKHGYGSCFAAHASSAACGRAARRPSLDTIALYRAIRV